MKRRLAGQKKVGVISVCHPGVIFPWAPKRIAHVKRVNSGEPKDKIEGG